MPITLYHWAPSAPSRCAYLTLKTLGLEFHVHEVNLTEREQYDEKFLKINPQHIVPTLEDNDFYLWESRAIASYLVDRYSKTDTLFPKNLEKRGVVNQKLYFDATTLYPAVRNICRPIIYEQERTISQDKKDTLQNALKYVDHYLEEEDFVCGKSLTLADISIFTTITSIQAIGWNFSEFRNIEKWIKRCYNHIEGTQENIKGCQMFRDLVLRYLEPNQL